MRRAGVRRALVGVGVPAIAIGIAGCGSDGAASQDDDDSGANPASPAASAVKQTARIQLSDAGCTPANQALKAGAITFAITNAGSSKVTEFELQDAGGIIIGERENVVPGVGGSFSVKLSAGTYKLVCTNGAREAGVLKVTGTAPSGSVATAQLATATRGLTAVCGGAG